MLKLYFFDRVPLALNRHLNLHTDTRTHTLMPPQYLHYPIIQNLTAVNDDLQNNRKSCFSEQYCEMICTSNEGEDMRTVGSGSGAQRFTVVFQERCNVFKHLNGKS